MPYKAQAALDSGLRKLALVVIAGTMMSILDTTIVNVAITPLARDLDASLATIQWVLTGYTLAVSMTIPVTGWAVERFGAKAAWMTCLLLFILGSVLCGAAWNVGALIAFRVLQGIGGGMIAPVGQVMLARAAGPERMARVMSAVAVPAMLGPVLGPVIGGLIVDDLSWRWMFYVNVPLCLLALALAARLLPPDAGRASARVDGRGLALLSPGLAAGVYGLSKAGADNTQLAVCLTIGVALTGAFVIHAVRTTRAPLVSVRAFVRRAFGMSSVALVIYSGALFGFMVVLPVYFQVVRGETPLRAGLLLAPLGIGVIIAMPVSGRLADRTAARWILIAGMALVGTGAIVFTQLRPGTSLAVLAGALFVAGLGNGAVMPPAMGAAYQGMPKAEVPAATAAFNVVVKVGSTVGTAALAVVLQQAIRARIPGASGSLSDAARLHGTRALSALTSAFGVSFWWVAAIVATAILPAIFIPPRPGASRPAMKFPPQDRHTRETGFRGGAMTSKPFTTCLWFDTQGEEAARYYTGIFKNSKLGRVHRYTEAGPGPEGSVATVEFELNGQKFLALNGGPEYQFTPAVSVVVECADQAEVDYYWDRLTEGGQEVACGWLTDKYGLSWQIVPTSFLDMINGPDRKKVTQVTAAMYKMKKMDIAALEQAYAGG